MAVGFVGPEGDYVVSSVVHNVILLSPQIFLVEFSIGSLDFAPFFLPHRVLLSLSRVRVRAVLP